MAVVRTARMIQIEDKRQIVLCVVFRPQISLLVRAIGAGALARVVNPADDVMVIVFFADAAEVRCKTPADFVRVLAHGMAGHAAALLEQLFAVSHVSGSLMFQRGTG